MELLLEKHSPELVILILAALILVTLLILVPQLLRHHHHIVELQHTERMRSLEQGFELPPRDDRSWAAGRTALLVPMVVMIAAGTVTCFLAAFHSDNLFGVTLAVWAVAGVVGLAAITGGVALMGRLAQLSAGAEEEMPSNPLEDMQDKQAK
jgi:uncharacterized membrane protein YbhN (UPF0104 family)